MKEKTAMGETILPKEKKDLFSNKLDSMPARDALNVLYNHYGYKHHCQKSVTTMQLRMD